MKTIDKNSLLPKYQQLRGMLLEKMMNYKIGQRFYSENELAKMFNIAPLTARKALTELEDEGLLRRERGSGTFVDSIPEYPRNIRVVEDCSIGILIADLEEKGNIAFEKVLLGAEKKALAKGYLLQIAQLSSDNLLPRMVTGNHITGILIVGQLNDEIERLLKVEGVPVVLMGLYSRSNDFHMMLSDFRMEGYQVAKYLLGLGHRKIGLIAGSCHVDGISSEILAGFREGLLENEGVLNEKLIKFDPEKDDYRLTKELLDSGEEVTALFLGNWLGVAQSLQAINENGLKIPEDISLIGHGDNVLVMHTNPALTSVKLFSEEIGEKSVELLLNVIKDPVGTPKKNYHSVQIIERDSCRALL